MSEGVSYTEEQLEIDMREQARFFKDMFSREILRIRTHIITDYRMPRQGWEAPFLDIIELCKKTGKNPAALQEAIDRAQNSLRLLDSAAEEEISDLHCRINAMLKNADNVR